MNGRNLIKQIGVGLLLCLLLFLFSGAKRSKSCRSSRSPTLASIHIVDRNGFAETINNKERLNQYQQVDFLGSQPYQKVLRIFTRDAKSNIRSIVTTYHENGNPKQFLEILNARANGIYCEWHENGRMSLMTKVIGGIADVTPLAERSWLFDGCSQAWDQEGAPIAEIYYCQGSLEGISTYFHPNGQIWKRIPYLKNKLDGVVEIFKNDGTLLQQQTYLQGEKQGPSVRYWDCQHLASYEEYDQDRLEQGQYFDKEGNRIAEVTRGTGYRAIFGKEHVQELQECIDGALEGEVRVFNRAGGLKRLYHIKNGIKHGEEIEYYERLRDPSAAPQARLAFYWHEGKIQGLAKTWYSNGNLESQREICNSAKNGVLTAWYLDGNLMMIEEYENDKLLRGEYFKKEEPIPVSQVFEGRGTATLFDAEGHFIQKIVYAHGKPEV